MSAVHGGEKDDGFGNDPGAVIEAAGEDFGEGGFCQGPIFRGEAFHGAAGVEIAEGGFGGFKSQGGFDKCGGDVSEDGFDHRRSVEFVEDKRSGNGDPQDVGDPAFQCVGGFVQGLAIFGEVGVRYVDLSITHNFRSQCEAEVNIC